MIASLSLILIPLLPAFAAWRGMRVAWVMAAGVAGLGLFGLALWMALAGTWPLAAQGELHDSYYVVAHWHYVISLAVLVAVIALAQAIKARRGAEDRLPTLALFGLMIVGLTLMLAPIAFARTTGLTGAVSWLAEVGGLFALAGLIGLIWLILLRPVLRFISGRR